MAGKTTTNLTQGGVCDHCDDEAKCCVCGVEAAVDAPLLYAQSGDHDHLLLRDGVLTLEAHGRLMCAEHYLEDAEKLGLTREMLGWPEEAPDDPA